MYSIVAELCIRSFSPSVSRANEMAMLQQVCRLVRCLSLLQELSHHPVINLATHKPPTSLSHLIEWYYVGAMLGIVSIRGWAGGFVIRYYVYQVGLGPPGRETS